MLTVTISCHVLRIPFQVRIIGNLSIRRKDALTGSKKKFFIQSFVDAKQKILTAICFYQTFFTQLILFGKYNEELVNLAFMVC